MRTCACVRIKRNDGNNWPFWDPTIHDCRCGNLNYNSLSSFFCKFLFFLERCNKFIPKGKKWGLGVGWGLVRVFRIPLKRIILPLSKVGSHTVIQGEFTTHFVVFIFEDRSFLQHVMSRFSTGENILYKQGRTALSQEEQREDQELDNRMCFHHIK